MPGRPDAAHAPTGQAPIIAAARAGVVQANPAALAALAALFAVAAGFVLRFWNLAGQILGGDELHAVRAALAQPMSVLLTTYQLADSCIPLTALDRLLLDHGVALDEWILRLPVLAAGLAALVVLPALARRHLAAPAVSFFAVLVALSPLLVLYSRIARSYMPATLFSFVAVMAFERRWTARAEGGEGPARRGGRQLGAATAYVVFGALAIWFHLGAAPIVSAPFLFAAGDLVLAAHASQRRRRAARARFQRPDSSPEAGAAAVPLPRTESGLQWLPQPPRHRMAWFTWSLRIDEGFARGFVALCAMAAGLGIACALFLVPALPSLSRLVAAKRQAQTVPMATWLDVLQLQAGTRAGQWVPAVLFWVLAVAGAVSLLRRDRRSGLYLSTLVLGQLLGILVLSPLGLARAQVLDRYLLPALPVVLMWVAAGLTAPWWPRQGLAAGKGAGDEMGQREPGGWDGRWRRRVQGVGAAGLMAVWVMAGPFADLDVRASSFLHHNDLVAFAVPRATVGSGDLPVAYRALGGPAGTAVVELPWPPVWDFGRSFYVYQEIHGLRALVASPAGTLPAGRLHLRNRVAPDPAALRASGARWVLVHRHLAVEESRLRLPAGSPPARPIPPPLAAQLAAAGARAIAQLTAAWGPPQVADDDVALWDLRDLRRRRQAASVDEGAAKASGAYGNATAIRRPSAPDSR